MKESSGGRVAETRSLVTVTSGPPTLNFPGNPQEVVSSVVVILHETGPFLSVFTLPSHQLLPTPRPPMLTAPKSPPCDSTANWLEGQEGKGSLAGPDCGPQSGLCIGTHTGMDFPLLQWPPWIFVLFPTLWPLQTKFIS